MFHNGCYAKCDAAGWDGQIGAGYWCDRGAGWASRWQDPPQRPPGGKFGRRAGRWYPAYTLFPQIIGVSGKYYSRKIPEGVPMMTVFERIPDLFVQHYDSSFQIWAREF